MAWREQAALARAGWHPGAEEMPRFRHQPLPHRRCARHGAPATGWRAPAAAPAAAAPQPEEPVAGIAYSPVGACAAAAAVLRRRIGVGIWNRCWLPVPGGGGRSIRAAAVAAVRARAAVGLQPGYQFSFGGASTRVRGRA